MLLTKTTQKFLEKNNKKYNNHFIKITKYSLRQKQQKKQINDKFLLFNHGSFTRNKSILSISEIPTTFKVSKLFTFCGFLCGFTIIFLPKKYIKTEMSLSLFPNINYFNNNNNNNNNINNNNYKLMLLFLICSMCFGYIGGNMYQYKTFKWGDSKRFHKVLGNLVNKTPLALMHSSSFLTIIYYGMFITFTTFETLLYGKPYGFNDNYIDKKTYKLLAKNKKLHQCTYNEIINRIKFSFQLNVHWMQSTFFIVFPIFFCGTSFLILYHRKYWLSLYSRIKKL